MMLLADIGNSRIKWATMQQGVLGRSTAEFYEDHSLEGLLESQWRSLERPTGVSFCSVGASAAGGVLENWVRDAWGIESLRVTSVASANGVRCAYANPQTLGSDRWAALVAARHKYQKAACIIDCGTAITLDALSADGEHLGGVIFPGVDLMRLALSTRTDGIPPAVTETVGVLAKSTAAGVGSGTIYAAAAGVDRVAAEMRSSLAGDSVSVLTGGGAHQLAPLLSTELIHDRDLVLYGLAVISGAFE